MEDATLTLLNSLFKHLEGSGRHDQLLFIDFPSAFNIIQPYIVTQRLLVHFNLSTNLVGWIFFNFLINRTQRVRVHGILSDKVWSSTRVGALTPVIFSLQ